MLFKISYIFYFFSVSFLLTWLLPNSYLLGWEPWELSVVFNPDPSQLSLNKISSSKLYLFCDINPTPWWPSTGSQSNPHIHLQLSVLSFWLKKSPPLDVCQNINLSPRAKICISKKCPWSILILKRGHVFFEFAFQLHPKIRCMF